MREPSIHITKSQFNLLLEQLEIKAFPTDAFFRQASKRAINSRAIVVSNKKVTKKVNQVLLADKGDTQLTADILYAVRMKLKHFGVRKITESNRREWTLLKELTSIINQFASSFEFRTAREAFIKYIEIGFQRMGRNNRNAIQRLISMAENIFFYYESQLYIQQDENPRKTETLYNIYNRRIADATGIVDKEPLKSNPEKYNHFLILRRYLDENKFDYSDYIEAQFEALAFCNGIPEPQNLYNEKAIDRYRKYMFKQGPISAPPSIEGSLWDKIKENIDNG